MVVGPKLRRFLGLHCLAWEPLPAQQSLQPLVLRASCCCLEKTLTIVLTMPMTIRRCRRRRSQHVGLLNLSFLIASWLRIRCVDVDHLHSQKRPRLIPQVGPLSLSHLLAVLSVGLCERHELFVLFVPKVQTRALNALFDCHAVACRQAFMVP